MPRIPNASQSSVYKQGSWNAINLRDDYEKSDVRTYTCKWVFSFKVVPWEATPVFQKCYYGPEQCWNLFCLFLIGIRTSLWVMWRKVSDTQWKNVSQTLLKYFHIEYLRWSKYYSVFYKWENESWECKLSKNLVEIFQFLLFYSQINIIQKNHFTYPSGYQVNF